MAFLKIDRGHQDPPSRAPLKVRRHRPVYIQVSEDRGADPGHIETVTAGRVVEPDPGLCTGPTRPGAARGESLRYRGVFGGEKENSEGLNKNVDIRESAHDRIASVSYRCVRDELEVRFRFGPTSPPA